MGKPSSLTPLSISTILRTPVPARDWILPGLPRNAVGALIGPGGAGKTTLALQIAVAQALGRATAGDLLMAPSLPLKVSLVSSEDPADVFAIRLQAILADVLGFNAAQQLDWLQHANSGAVIEQLEANLRIYSCTGRDMRIVSNLKRTAFLEEMINATTGSDLTIVETVARLHDGDENSTAAMTVLTSTLEHWAIRNNSALVVLHHSSKAADLNSRGDSQHAARGASAFVDNLRYVANLFTVSPEEAERMQLGEHRRSYVRFEVTKANYIAPEPPRTLRRRAGGVLKTETLSSTAADLRRSRRTLA
jgi:regulatory protein RepA